MKYINVKNTLILYLLLGIASLIIKKDIISILNMLLLISVFTYILLKNTKLLLIAILIGAVFFQKIGEYNSMFQYFPIYIYILMLIEIIIKKKNKVAVGKTIIIFAIISFLLSLVPLIETKFTIGNLILSSLKRYGFIIVFIFGINIESNKIGIYEILMKYLGIILIFNIPIAIFQLNQGFNRDNITGLLGNFRTGIVICLFAFYISFLLYKHYISEISTLKLFLVVIIALIYCAIAEVKFGFVIIAIILLAYFSIFQGKVKSMVLISIFSSAFILLYSVFVSLYPTHDFLNKEFMVHYLYEQQYSAGSVNRFSFKSDLDNSVLQTNTDKLFGKGIGSGNVSKNSLFRGEINKEYDYLKYYWFALPYLYLETGLIGMVLYCLIYIIPIIISINIIKKTKNYKVITVIFMSIINLIFLVYNDSILDYSTIIVYWLITGMIFKENISLDINKLGDKKSEKKKSISLGIFK